MPLPANDVRHEAVARGPGGDGAEMRAPEGDDMIGGEELLAGTELEPTTEAGPEDAGLLEPDEAVDLGLEGDEVEVTTVTSRSAIGLSDEGDAVAPPDQEDMEAQEEEEEPETLEATEATAREDEPQSFLAMYFRDMAELDVLRPEQEFETARHIERLELDLWKTLLSYAPAAPYTADAIEKAMEKSMPELKDYRALAEKARRKLALSSRAGFDKFVEELSTKLKELDIDRLFVDAAITEVLRLARAKNAPGRHEPLPSFASTRAFNGFVKAVNDQANRVKAAKNEFVKANLRLVVSIARRFNHGRLPLPDLIQEGNIGLMKAVERYDYRRGFRFSTYASWWIRHAISRALADKGRAVRLPVHMIDAYHKIAKSERELQSKLERPATVDEIASATGIEPEKLEKMKTFLNETPVSLDRPISDEDGRRLIDVLVDPNEQPGAPEQMMNSETQKEMLKLLGGLKPIEADILRKRFGLVNDRERTLKEIGDEYRLSRERVRQLQEQALGKMRRAMAKLEIL
jgi:RNA polymerase primary sigma factor